MLFWEGDPVDEVMILVTGRAKASVVSPDGREVILNILDSGDLLGELSAIDGGQRSATVTTLEPAEALIMPRANFGDLLANRPGIVLELLRLVTGKLRESSQRQFEFATVDALGRLSRCILDLADRYAEPDAKVRQVQIPFAQHEVAAWTGLSREAVVKGLRSLRTLGWIETNGRWLTLTDEDALRNRATRP